MFDWARTGPITPIITDEVLIKRYLRLSDNDNYDDTLIAQLQLSAISEIENYIGSPIELSEITASGYLLRNNQVIARRVDNVTAGGEELTIQSTPEVLRVSGVIGSFVSLKMMAGFKIIPEVIKECILLLMAEIYENRENRIKKFVGVVEHKLAPYKAL